MNDLNKKLKEYEEGLAELIEDFCENASKERQLMLKTTLQSLHNTTGLALKILDTSYDIASDDFIVQEKGALVSNGVTIDGDAFGSRDSIEKNTIIEGVFDGRNMVGADGNCYTVPENYASKSKLVEGDILKLRINDDGSFVYKQINPIIRQRVRGCLVFDINNQQFYVACKGRKWGVLTASVNYFKGDHNDEVIFLIPKDGISKWAAVENVIKNIDDIDHVQIHLGNEYTNQIKLAENRWRDPLLQEDFYQDLAKIDNLV